ncbi:MAG: aspartyl/asparaginyl beta-hydroxylase domain-containing protein [Nitrospirales bacterium]
MIKLFTALILQFLITCAVLGETTNVYFGSQSSANGALSLLNSGLMVFLILILWGPAQKSFELPAKIQWLRWVVGISPVYWILALGYARFFSVESLPIHLFVLVFGAGVLSLQLAYAFSAYRVRRRRKAESLLLKRILNNISAEFGANGTERLVRLIHKENEFCRREFPPRTSFPDPASFSWIGEFEAKADTIREELLQLFEKRSQELRPYPGQHAGSRWKSITLCAAGKVEAENAKFCPETLAFIESRIPGGTAREVIISVMQPGMHIKPHSDDTMGMLTCHMGLSIPPNCAIRGGGELRTWEEGKCIVLDPNYEHEAWNRSGETRLLLLFDFCNPACSEIEQEFFRKYYEATSPSKSPAPRVSSGVDS